MLEGFGQYVKNLRHTKNYTLTQMGALLGVDSGALSKIENNKRPLDEKLLPRLSEMFDLDMDELKEQFFSEKVADMLFKNDCPEEALDLAREKLRYRRSKGVYQATLKFDVPEAKG